MSTSQAAQEPDVTTLQTEINDIVTAPDWDNKFSKIKQYFFIIPNQNTYCGYSLELPQRGNSNEYPQ